MLKTRFSEKELTELCQMLRNHKTNCATLVEILKLAYSSYPNDAGATFRHIILLKEFGVIDDRDYLCNICVHEVIEHHADTCEEHKRRMSDDKYFFPCPEDHYDYSKCESAIWMTNFFKIHDLTKGKDFNEGNTILKETFPDMPEDMLHNQPHFLCEKHVGSMKPYSDKITEYR